MNRLSPRNWSSFARTFISASLSDATVVRGAESRWRASATSPEHQEWLGGAGVGVEVNKKAGKILVKHIYAALDVGLVVNLALVENQMSGSLTVVRRRRRLSAATVVVHARAISIADAERRRGAVDSGPLG